MAQGADNDNLARSATDVLRSSLSASPLQRDGNAALAPSEATIASPSEDTAATEASGDKTVQSSSNAEASPLAQGFKHVAHAMRENTAVQQSSVPPARSFAVSEAAELSSLGIGELNRPIPRLQVPVAKRDPGFASADRPADEPTFKYDAGSATSARPAGSPASSSHLFNSPIGGADRPEMSTDPFAKAVEASVRKPVTKQPGFVAGLIAASMAGAGLYLYLA